MKCVRRAEKCVTVRRNKASKVQLPGDGGVIDSEGFPFYHRVSVTLTGQMMQRISDCGIQLKVGAYSAKEDRRLRKNWRRYCRQNDIPLTDSQLYCGYQNSLLPPQLYTHVQHCKRSTNFLPKMCRKLNNRTGSSVQKRISRLFSANDNRKWTSEDDSRLRQLYISLGPKWVRIGASMDRSADSCYFRHSSILNSLSHAKGRLKPREKAKLIKLVMSDMGEQCLKTALQRADYRFSVGWPDIGRSMQRYFSSCLRHWGAFRRRYLLMEERRNDPNSDSEDEQKIVQTKATKTLTSLAAAVTTSEEDRILFVKLASDDYTVQLPFDQRTLLFQCILEQNARRVRDVDFERVYCQLADQVTLLESFYRCKKVLIDFRSKYRGFFSKTRSLSDSLNEVIKLCKSTNIGRRKLKFAEAKKSKHCDQNGFSSNEEDDE